MPISLKEHPVAPDIVAPALDACRERKEANRRRAADARFARERELADIDRQFAGILKAVEDSAWNTRIRDRLTELKECKALAAAESVKAPTAPSVTLLPSALTLYRKQVDALELGLHDASIREEAAEALRGLISRIVHSPEASGGDGVCVTLEGDLPVILRLTASTPTAGHEPLPINDKSAQRALSSSQVLSLVAGTGFEPVTFRL